MRHGISNQQLLQPRYIDQQVCCGSNCSNAYLETRCQRNEQAQQPELSTSRQTPRNAGHLLALELRPQLTGNRTDSAVIESEDYRASRALRGDTTGEKP